MSDRNTLLFGTVFVLATAGIAADHLSHAPALLPPVVAGSSQAGGGNPCAAAGNPCASGAPSGNPCAAGNPCSAGNPCAARPM